MGGGLLVGGTASLKSARFAKDKSRAIQTSVNSAKNIAARAGHAKNIGRLGVGGMVLGAGGITHGVMQGDMSDGVIGGGLLAGGMMTARTGFKTANELTRKRDKAADNAVRLSNSTRRSISTGRGSSPGLVRGSSEIAQSVTKLRSSGKIAGRMAMGASALGLAGGAYAVASSGLFGV